MNYPTKNTVTTDTGTVHVPGIGKRRASKAMPDSPNTRQILAKRFEEGGLDAVRNPDHRQK